MVRTATNDAPRILYVRLSRDDAKSMSISNQTTQLRAYAPGAPIALDRNVSGEINLTDPNTAWALEVRPFLAKNPGAQVVLFTLDRMGRKKGAMMFEAEKIIDAGGSIYCVRDDRLFDDMDDAAQAIEIMMASYNADVQRVEGKRKTNAALKPMKEAGIHLGRKPELTAADLATIRALRSRGLGYTAIGKAMSVERMRDGQLVEVPRSARLIKKALSGSYKGREEFDRNDLQKRKEMAARAVLGRSERREEANA